MDIRPHKTKPPIERFLALTRINPAGCWDWLGGRNEHNYGQFILSSKAGERRIRIAPYRFIWEHFNGPMPEGLEPDHTCNNRNCVNPEHIEPVTHAENIRRAVERRRLEGRKIKHTPKPRPTHCPHGHEYTVANMMRGGKGLLQCRACNSASTARRKALAARTLLAD